MFEAISPTVNVLSFKKNGESIQIELKKSKMAPKKEVVYWTVFHRLVAVPKKVSSIVRGEIKTAYKNCFTLKWPRCKTMFPIFWNLISNGTKISSNCRFLICSNFLVKIESKNDITSFSHDENEFPDISVGLKVSPELKIAHRAKMQCFSKGFTGAHFFCIAETSPLK